MAFISAPKDIMTGEAAGEVLTPAWRTSLGAADTDAIAVAAGLLSKAKNPVLMLGLLASEENAAEAVGEFIAKTNMPIVCTYQGAGVVPKEHFDRFGGRVGLFRTQPADRILDSADLVITIGYDPIEFEPGLWNLGKKRDLIHIDVVAADIDKDYRPHVELIGNIAATVRGLTSQMNGVAPAGSAELLREVAHERTAFGEKAAALNGTPIHPMRLVHELQGLLSDDMTLCLDMGSFHIWLARYLYSFRARQILMTNGQQTLGAGLPWAIAASLVRPNEKVMSVSGDGGFLFSAMELETAVRLKCNLVHVVWIDGFYDMVGIQEMAKYGRLSGVKLGPVDIVKFAEAFSAKGLSTLKEALAMEGPVLVGVPVDYRDNHRLMEIVHPEALS